MRKVLLVFFFFLFSCVVANAAVQPKLKLLQQPAVLHAPLQLKQDSTAVKVRSFDKQAMERYSKDKEFAYNTDVNKKSWWERFWDWVWSWFTPKSKHGSTTTFSGGNPLGLILVLLGIAFLIYKLLQSDISNIFSRKATGANLPYTESLENIHEITFDEEIEKALNQHNYKLAVRLLYLSCLKQLNDAQLIHWQIEKTNTAYVDELTNDDQRQTFGVLTRQFEYVWYGDFAVDGRSYQNINTLFMDFKKMLP